MNLLNEANINALAQGLARVVAESAATHATISRQLVAAAVAAGHAQRQCLETAVRGLVHSPLAQCLRQLMADEARMSAARRTLFYGAPLKSEGKSHGQ